MPIPRHEVAPVTDQEWAEALKDYGRDRDDIQANSTSEPDAELDNPRLFDPEQDALHESPPSSPQHIPHRALHHRDSFESLNQLRDGELYPPASPNRRPTRQSTLASTASVNSDASTQTLGLNLTLPVTTEENRCGKSPRGSFGSEDGFMLKDPNGSTSALGIAYTVGAPPRASLGCVIENDSRSRQAEKDELRQHYEKEGWLPGPAPSRMTKMRRKRAIRRLGLCCNQEEAQERQAIMAKYAELAKQIFQTCSASVSILMGEEEILWGANPEASPVRYRREQAACSHAVLREDLKCFVVADLSKDWRFRNNPILPNLPGKFYASAPLRYKRNHLSVDIGTLCIIDKEPRDTFDAREQGILLNLANMLVYQMITLQSEIMAKKSSAMYENCISFLRRSVVPNQAKVREEAEKEKREQREKEREQRREQRKQGKGTTNGIAVPSPLHAHTITPAVRPRRGSRVDSKVSSSAASASPEVPQLAVKTGPRDSKVAKREATMADKALFTDAAKTMRKILKADAVAIVNIEEYQLFIRRATGIDIDPKRKIKEKTKEAIITSFLQGKPWPDDIDPVIHYVPKSSQPGVNVLGTDSSSGPCAFHFGQRGAERTLSDFLESYLKTKHFWWDREDAENDDLSRRIVDLMPNEAQTILGSAFLTWEGKCRFAMFVSWNKPPAEFGDSQTIALPFAWIMGGCTMAALAIRTVRNLEQSQISYSNLQAHELRTPLHQILAITQLLRSSMNDLADTPQSLNNNSNSLTTTQQIRDLLPFLDAIDTSGKTLHGIVDNILSFLDLKGKDNMVNPTSPSLLNSPSGATQSIEVMFEELIHEACEEDKRSRRANGQPMCNTETVFEIIPPLLGEQVTEDTGGALRRALSKILSNAYKFIEGEGCVEIYVDDVSDLLPPEGCEDLALSKRIKIKIVDNGKGMEAAFVQGKLGEPWAKEDPYATGSGLSVHLAYRIIDLMGGHMEITSGPGQGCIVELEVPVPRRTVTSPTSPEMENTPQLSISDPVQLAKKPDDIELKRKVALVGFDRPGPGWLGLSKLQEALHHQYAKLGCELVDKDQADLVVLNGQIEETVEGVEIIEGIRTKDIVYLVGNEHEAHADVLLIEQQGGKRVRRFRTPATPSILRESLFPGQSKSLVAETSSRHGAKRASINSPEQVNEHGRTASNSDTFVGSSVNGDKPRTHFADPVTVSDQLEIDKPASPIPPYICPIIDRFTSLWKPRKMDVEEAVACLSLGDYFSSRKRTSLRRVSSNGSTSNAPSTPTLDSRELDSTTQLDTPQMGSESDMADTRGSLDLETPMDFMGGKEEVEEVEEEPEELVKVMVVEDNMVNRKILVKILSSKLPIEVCEAEDGHAAVELFKSFTTPVIVLLDINMPKMDGYQACTEMRAIEKAAGKKHASQIIAVTALGGEEERRRGLVECGMNQWHTKPCSKAKIHEIVHEAREILVDAKKELMGLGL